MRQYVASLFLLLSLTAPVHAGRTFADGSYMSISSALATATPFTVCAWAYSTGAGATAGVFGLVQSGSDTQRFAMYKNSTQLNVETRNGGTISTATTSSGTFPETTWTHVCGVWASTTSRAAFTNGGNKATNAVSTTPTSIGKSLIGRYTDGTGNLEWNGTLEHIAVWNVALSDTEIARLAEKIDPRQVQRSALIAYVPIWGNNSPEIDVVAARTWTITGTLTQALLGAPMGLLSRVFGGQE